MNSEIEVLRSSLEDSLALGDLDPSKQADVRRMLGLIATALMSEKDQFRYSVLLKVFRFWKLYYMRHFEERFEWDVPLPTISNRRSRQTREKFNARWRSILDMAAIVLILGALGVALIAQMHFANVSDETFGMLIWFYGFGASIVVAFCWVDKARDPAGMEESDAPKEESDAIEQREVRHAREEDGRLRDPRAADTEAVQVNDPVSEQFLRQAREWSPMTSTSSTARERKRL